MQAFQDDEIKEPTLGDLLKDIWAAKLSLLIFGALFTLIAAGFIVTATPYYKSKIILSPANPMNGAEMSSLLADDNLFALRYLVQRVGGANSTDFLRFENIYDGPSVAKILLKDERMVDGLKADRRYGYLTHKKDWPPQRFAEYLQKRLKISPVGASPLRTLSYDHPDPEFATYLLGEVHQISDFLIRQNIHVESSQRIDYLKSAIDETQNPEHRRALTTLLLEQERLRMLVSIDQAYAAGVVEPPSASVKPTWPDPYLIFPVFLFAGFVLGYAVYSLRKK